MRFLSLFSGIEAASQAWKPLGWECVGVSEIEAFPCNALSQIHPDVPNLGDITKITELDIFTLGQIDLVVFGSPCQDLSVAGKRKGLDGARSGLFHDAMRIVGWARKHGGCRFALWENVPGAFSSNGGDDFGVVVGQMAGLECPTPPKGWGTEGATVGTEAMVEWSVLDAQWFGVAQRRRRVFALADFGDWANRPPILLEPQGLRGDIAPSREAGQSVTRAVEVGAAGSRVHTATCGGIGDYSSSRSNAIRASGADLGRGCEVLVSGELVRPVRIAEPVWPAEVCCTLDTTFGTKQGLENQHVNAGCPMFVPYVAPYVAYSEGVLPFDTTQISSPANYSCPKTGDPCHPLSAQAHAPSIAYAIQGSMVGRSDNAGPQGNGINAEVCFTQNTTDRHAVAYGIPGNWIGRTPENGGNAVEPMHNVAPCLTKTDRHGVCAPFSFDTYNQSVTGDVTQTLCSRGDSPGGNAHLVPAVCAPVTYAFDSLASNSMMSSNPDSGCNEVSITKTIDTTGCNPACNQGGNAVLHPIAWSEELTASVDLSGTMVKGGEGGRHAGVMLPNMQVRRLTPRECERLQGFPDDHTLITVKGKPAADGPRYKALGNSMAVPVMHWIGKRIDIVNNFF